MAIYALTDNLIFPPPHLANDDGLLAVGGDLSVERLLLAYRQGIFPWFEDDTPILWWSPDPRLVLYPQEFKIGASLRKSIKKNPFHITLDTAFEQVLRGCAEIERPRQDGTWITENMVRAYGRLHEAGYAHSIEAWRNGELAGGLYGVSLGRCFFGESMFARQSNASKVAFVTLMDFLTKRQFALIDCQVTTAHLLRFGAREIPRQQFLAELTQALQTPTLKGAWRFDKK